MTTKITEQNISNIANLAVDWQSVVTADGSTNTNAVAGKGYFIDTTSAAHTIVLPASPSFGDTIIINDYASTFGTNTVTLNPNGNKIEASTTNALLSTNDQTHTLVFTDSTQGWKIVNQDTASNIQPEFIAATGGTIVTEGSYKVHVFTGDGCFVVSSTADGTTTAPNIVDYIVVAGGGGSDDNRGGGGGAGGYRESKASASPTHTASPHTASPKAASSGISVSATTYPITVGAGGSGNTPCVTQPNGSNSVFSTITSAGGGGGGRGQGDSSPGAAGGSGGGGGCEDGNAGTGGSGNTPSVSPPQGNPGGNGGEAPDGGSRGGGGGGGGATASGENAPSTFDAGKGGDGAGSTFITSTCYGTPGPNGSLRYFAGGGGGGAYTAGDGDVGGAGGGGSGICSPNHPTPAVANTGGGGGAPGNGGKGIVMIRYKYTV